MPQILADIAKIKVILYKITGKPWNGIGTDLFMFKNSNFLCVVDYRSKFPLVK